MPTDKKKLKEFLASCKVDTTWQDQARWRKENRYWLKITQRVAIVTLTKLSDNEDKLLKPANKFQLANASGLSDDRINSILRGKQRLTIDDVTKLNSSLGIDVLYESEKLKRNYDEFKTLHNTESK